MEALIASSALVIVATAAFFYWLRKGEIQGIPEPPGNYLFGHVFQLGGNFCNTFLKWKKEVGPVFQLRLANIRVIVFNDKESISKVCAVAQSAGRLRFGVGLKLAEVFGAGILNSEGPSWEEQRQFYQKAFRTFGVGRDATERSLKDQVQETLKDWEKLDGAPFQLEGCSMSYVFNATWTVLGSQKMESAAISKLAHQFASLPKLDTVAHQLAYVSVLLADTFTSAVEEKLAGIKALSDVGAKLIAVHQKDRVPGEPRDVIDQILDKVDITQDENSMFNKKYSKSAHGIAEIMYASMDTTSKTLEWLMLYLAQEPKVASKLYAEIDRVFDGNKDSLPGLDEREKMPYAQACILEALRMSSVAPLAIPHKALEDFEFNGALVPKGTILLMNIYGVHYDPEVWDQPQEFKPQRFLTPEGDKVDVSAKNKLVAFGAGRRMCPGYLMAMDSMFLFVVNVYRKFRFEVDTEQGGLKEEKFGFIRYTPEGTRMKAVVVRNNI